MRLSESDREMVLGIAIVVGIFLAVLGANGYEWLALGLLALFVAILFWIDRPEAVDECGLCGRPLTRSWWNRWILGPFCNGKDLSECKRLFMEQVVAAWIARNRGSDG